MSDSKRVWNDGDPSKPYTISFWEENPIQNDKLGEWEWKGGNDTCWMATDFATEKEARDAMSNLDAHFHKSHRDVPYVLLDGPEIHEVTVRHEALKRAQRRKKDDDRAERSEFAMQQGMGLGVAAYNDAMGYDCEPYDPDMH